MARRSLWNSCAVRFSTTACAVISSTIRFWAPVQPSLLLNKPNGPASLWTLIPAYVDMAIGRWQKLTSEVAMLASDGRTFDQITAERAVVEVA